MHVGNLFLDRIVRLLDFQRALSVTTIRISLWNSGMLCSKICKRESNSVSRASWMWWQKRTFKSNSVNHATTILLIYTCHMTTSSSKMFPILQSAYFDPGSSVTWHSPLVFYFFWTCALSLLFFERVKELRLWYDMEVAQVILGFTLMT